MEDGCEEEKCKQGNVQKGKYRKDKNICKSKKIMK